MEKKEMRRNVNNDLSLTHEEKIKKYINNIIRKIFKRPSFWVVIQHSGLIRSWALEHRKEMVPVEKWCNFVRNCQLNVYVQFKMPVNQSRMYRSMKNLYSNERALNSLTDETKCKCVGSVVLILYSNIVERYKLWFGQN